MLLIHLKSSLCSQDVYIFLSGLFGFVEKNVESLSRKRSLISKFMTSVNKQLQYTIHILLKVSRRKGYQSLKFGQLIEYNQRNILFFKNHAENEAGRLL